MKWKRLQKDIQKISKHIRVKKIKDKFYRLYFRHAYLHEMFGEMPQIGRDVIEADRRLESRDYYEEYEDNVELTREIKNYIEGYWDSLDRIKTRGYMMRNDDEFYKAAVRAYRQIKVH